MGDFVHLHLHSEYSLLDGACRIADIPAAAKSAGHSAVAITDHGVMYGAVAFYKACRAEGIKPIIGCEVYVAPRSRFDKTHDRDAAYNHLVLLCKNEVGYRNLIKLVSLGFTEGFYSKPRVDMELLAQYSEGLIALSACLAGFIPRAIAAGDFESAEKHALELNRIFGDGNFYLEVQNHGIPEESIVSKGMLELSAKLGIGLVATNDVHYVKKSDAETQAVLLCIQTNNVISDGRPIGFETDEFYYKSTDEMADLFGNYPNALENTVKIAEMCDFDFHFDKIFLPSYKPDNGQTPKEYLRSLAESGFEKRRSEGNTDLAEHSEDEYRERLDYELEVIDNMGYNEYFLVVWDFVNFAKSRGIPVGPGRGSGAGSLVAFLLAITDIDPLRFDLLFERFLNPERVSMPDIDIDFCYIRRDEVIAYVIERYGADHASQIVTFGTLAARAAVRDVGRALGMSYSDVDTVAKLIPQEKDVTIASARKKRELAELCDSDAKYARLIDIAAAIEGMPRHSSTHAAGVVITDRPLTDHVPLSVNGDTVVTQFDMDTIAKLGLLKFDFLSLRNLTIIDDAEKEIRRTRPDFDITKIPLDDKASYSLIASGHTEGIFQLESAGMRQMLMNLVPDCINDIMAALALYRPGPMDSIPRYIESRNNPESVNYPAPCLEPVLKVTGGCILYQEQVMEVFRRVAGYSFGRADIVRRAMAKKKADELEKERGTFISGAEERGMNRESAEKLFDDMMSFASYAFNKSHAAAYAVVTYRTAYLSAHYPREYFAALLTSVLGNLPKMAEYISDCSKRGIGVLPPEINESGINFTVSGDNIRYGLLAIKNVGRNYIEAIIREREKRPFASFIDFVYRMSEADSNKRQIESLIKCGAFDGLGVYRSRLLAAYDKILESVSDRNRGNITGQLDIFSVGGGNEAAPTNDFSYPELPDFSSREKLALEKESAGIYFSGHILDDYSAQIEFLSPEPMSKIADRSAEPYPYADKQRVRVAGVVTSRTNKNTRRGDSMAFVTLEDGMGAIEAVVFPKVLERYTEILLPDSAVCAEGTLSLREDEEGAKLLLTSASELLDNTRFTSPGKAETKPIARPAEQTTGNVLFLKLPDLECEKYKRAVALIKIFGGGCRVKFYSEKEGKYYSAEGLSTDAGAFVLRELKELLGESSVVLK